MPGQHPMPVPMLVVDHDEETVVMAPEPLAHEMLEVARTMTPT